jgi:Nuclease-related domain
MPAKLLKLRRPDLCVACGGSLAPGIEAWWDRDSRTVTCAACHAGLTASPSIPPPDQAFDRGTPGASLAREYERRKTNRQTRVRKAHPRIGGLLLALNDEPQHQRAFNRGDAGEQRIGAYLEKATANGPTTLLHNRRMPGGHGDIDHIGIAPTGIYVIDTKDHRGKIKIARPLLGKSKLLINGRDHTQFLDGLDRQIAAVRTALAHAQRADIPIQGAVCFTKADLPFLHTQKLRSHLLIYSRALARRLNRSGPIAPATLDELARNLASSLPPA